MFFAKKDKNGYYDLSGYTFNVGVIGVFAWAFPFFIWREVSIIPFLLGFVIGGPIVAYAVYISYRLSVARRNNSEKKK